MILSTILFSSMLYYNIEYKSINSEYIYRPSIVKNITFKSDKLTVEKKQLLYKWCKVHANKKVSGTDINTIIEKVHDISEYPLLLLAVFSVESAFDKDARSKKGALGLGQVMPLWIPEFKKPYGIKNKADLKKIGNNIKASNYIITYYTEKEGSLAKGLNRYVNGSNSYVRKVLKRYADITFYSKFGSYYNNKY